jgi:hypothetical protein
MSVYQTETFVVSSIPAGTSFDYDITLASAANVVDIVSIKISAGLGIFDVYKDSARTGTKRVLHKIIPPLGTVIGPVMDSEIFDHPYEDEGATGVIHSRIFNNGVGAVVYTITITYRMPGALRPADASGSDQAGISGNIYSGAGTGAGKVAPYQIWTPVRGASSSTVQPFAQSQIIRASKLGVSDNVSTALFDVDLPSAASFSCYVMFTVMANNGTEYQVRQLHYFVSAVNKAGTIASSIDLALQQATVASSGTILITTATITNGSGKITVNMQPDSSLTSPVDDIYYEIHQFTDRVITLL